MNCRHARCKSLRHHRPKSKRLFIKEKRILCIVELYKKRDIREILIILLLVLRFSLTTLLLCFQTHITRQFELGRHVDNSFNNQSATYRSDTDYTRSVFIAVNSLFKFINSQNNATEKSHRRISWIFLRYNVNEYLSKLASSWKLRDRLVESTTS